MANSMKFFAAIALLAVVAVSCGKVEKILPKKDGLWQIKSEQITVFVNNVQDTSYTEVDSLGQIMFEKDGGGYSADFSGNNKVTFTWEVNSDNDKITITDTSGVPQTMDILESSNKSQTWQGSTTFDFLGISLRTDVKSTLERKD